MPTANNRITTEPASPAESDKNWSRWPKGLLVIGIGNCGRADDGLGWAFLERLEAGNGEAKVAYRYQLQIEDAELISHHPKILFIDATEEVLPTGFKYRTCQPTPRFEYSSHALSPETITGLCQQLYDASPQVHILAIQGYQWGLREGLSPPARRNLLAALKFFYDQ